MLSHAAAEGLRRGQPELAGRLFADALPARLFRPGLRTRVAARLRGAALDRALADGADPADCPRLAARAAQLTCRDARARLADTVERFVVAAELPSWGRVSPARGGVRANRAQFVELAARLRSDAPVYARGMAELKLMLRDGTGPAYLDRHGEALARQLAVVFAGLNG
jgi:hypothetical protein